MLIGNLDVEKDINADFETVMPMTLPLEQYTLLRDAAHLFSGCLVILTAAATKLEGRDTTFAHLASLPFAFMLSKPYGPLLVAPKGTIPKRLQTLQRQKNKIIDVMRLFGSVPIEPRQAENICHELPTLDKRPTVRHDPAGQAQGIRSHHGADEDIRYGYSSVWHHLKCLCLNHADAQAWRQVRHNAA